MSDDEEWRKNFFAQGPISAKPEKTQNFFSQPPQPHRTPPVQRTKPPGPEIAQVYVAAAMLAEAKAAASRMMAWGLVWLLGGALLTVGTYAAAASGEMYGVFWGAIVFGGYRFLRGLYYYSNPVKLLR